MVAGLTLTDGTSVVVKAYQPRFTERFLSTVVSIQRHLATGFYPCAAPLGGPRPFGLGWATAETMIADPGPTPAMDRDLVSAATGLARLVRYAEGQPAAGLDPHPLQAAPGVRYPAPHSAVFDFAVDEATAGWIDALADVAIMARLTDTSRPVVTHSDWSARNVRLGRHGVSAVFDLDSLALMLDAVAAGQAAVTWSTTMEAGEPALANPDEIGRFLDVYQTVRGYRFRRSQMHAAWGGALGVLAYTARCEHALRRPGLATECLMRHGDALAGLSCAA